MAWTDGTPKIPETERQLFGPALENRSPMLGCCCPSRRPGNFSVVPRGLLPRTLRNLPSDRAGSFSSSPVLTKAHQVSRNNNKKSPRSSFCCKIKIKNTACESMNSVTRWKEVVCVSKLIKSLFDGLIVLLKDYYCYWKEFNWWPVGLGSVRDVITVKDHWSWQPLSRVKTRCRVIQSKLHFFLIRCTNPTFVESVKNHAWNLEEIYRQWKHKTFWCIFFYNFLSKFI